MAQVYSGKKYALFLGRQTDASTPVNIVINSDGLTNTILYRKGSLGRFDSITIKLRPGNYTIVGNRNGYRDVRINFDVLPEKENMQILVSCTEEI